MNIFNRNKTLDDDLPGRQPRVTYPSIENDIGDTVRDQFAKRPRTPAMLATALETAATQFEQAVADAESAAADYCHIHAEFYAIIEDKLEAIEIQRKELQRLRSTLPRVEKRDEETPSDPDPVDNGNASTGQVKDRSSQELPIANRRPIPLRPGSPKV